MWKLGYKESWAPKNWCFWTVVLEKTLESPLYCKEIKPVNHKGNQSWIFIGRTDAKTEAPILWSPDAKNWLIRKDPYIGKDWRHEKKGMTEEEMLEWSHQLNGHEFEQAPGVGDGQGILTCSMGLEIVGYDWEIELNVRYIHCLFIDCWLLWRTQNQSLFLVAATDNLVAATTRSVFEQEAINLSKGCYITNWNSRKPR